MRFFFFFFSLSFRPRPRLEKKLQLSLSLSLSHLPVVQQPDPPATHQQHLPRVRVGVEQPAAEDHRAVGSDQRRDALPRGGPRGLAARAVAEHGRERQAVELLHHEQGPGAGREQRARDDDPVGEPGGAQPGPERGLEAGLADKVKLFRDCLSHLAEEL